MELGSLEHLKWLYERYKSEKGSQKETFWLEFQRASAQYVVQLLKRTP